MNMKKMWLYTSTQDHKILGNLDDTIMVPTDWNSASRLDSEGIRYVLPEQHIKRSEYVQLDKTAEAIATNWWKKGNFNTLQHMDLPLGYLLEWEFHITLAKFLKQLLELDRMVRIEKPDVIIGRSGNDMFARLQQFIAAKHGIEYSQSISIAPEKSFHMDVIPITFKVGSKPVTIRLRRHQLDRISNAINGLTKLIRVLNSGKKSTKRVLLLDFNLIQYESMLAGLEEAGLELFLLNKRRPIIWNIESLKIELKQRYRFATLSEYAGAETLSRIDHMSRSISSQIDKVWANDSNRSLFSSNDLEFWSVIEGDFKDFCKSRMVEGIKDLELGNAFLSREKFHAIMMWGDMLPFEKTMTYLAKRNRVPTICIQHGTLTTLRDDNGEWTFPEFKGISADYIASWGKISTDMFINQGNPPGKIAEIGSPRYDGITSSDYSDDDSGGDGMILLATSGLPSSFSLYNTISAARRYEEFIRRICKAVLKSPSKKLVVKLHPFADEIIDVISLVSSISDRIRIAKNENTLNLIAQSQLVIAPKFTSVILESMILGRPTIVFDPLEGMLDPQYLPYASSRASLDLKRPEDAEIILERFFSDAGLRASLTDNSRAFLSAYLANPGSSTKALSRFVYNNT
jgi:hypothetical protein